MVTPNSNVSLEPKTTTSVSNMHSPKCNTLSNIFKFRLNKNKKLVKFSILLRDTVYNMYCIFIYENKIRLGFHVV